MVDFDIFQYQCAFNCVFRFSLFMSELFGFVNSLFQDFWIKDFSKSTNLAPYKFRSFSSIVAWCLCAQRAARAVFLLLLLSNCSGAALALLNRLSVQFLNFAVRIHMWVCVSGKKKFQTEKIPSEIIKKQFFWEVNFKKKLFYKTKSWPLSHSPFFWRFHPSYQVGIAIFWQIFVS